MKPAHHPESKLPWSMPALEVLPVSETMNDGGVWSFAPTDDFYQRSLLLDS
ncbi:hypothetical protein [Cohnella hashimotonis]|uniref:Uncharacterized protein n=1 Tax=Cohnella hashimotonis TaxID=2826895 RepID=A0ABT6TT04_9BACL|nr:hypothetical protein [Cohnella hashimotonis]MDI4648927.1 hypothetical protein [Cohnella hashimotonis]